MKLTVLGSGTCGSQLPGIANRQPPAFVVEADGELILFDCSEGLRFRLEAAGFKYSDIHHVAISHAHPDHYALVHYVQSIGCYNVWVGPKNELMDIYAPKQIVDEFETLWKAYVPDDPERQNPIWTELRFHAMTQPDGRTVRIGSIALSARSVYHGHGRTDAAAFRLETADGRVFAYSGDSGLCDPLVTAAANADLFLCEASARVGDEEMPRKYGHLNPRVAGEIAKRAGAKKLVFFHYTGFDPDEKMIDDCLKSGFGGEIVCAKDYQIIEF